MEAKNLNKNPQCAASEQSEGYHCNISLYLLLGGVSSITCDVLLTGI